MSTIGYDTGALLAAERRNPDFLALHDELTAARIRPIVPVDLTHIAGSIGVNIRLYPT